MAVEDDGLLDIGDIVPSDGGACTKVGPVTFTMLENPFDLQRQVFWPGRHAVPLAKDRQEYINTFGENGLTICERGVRFANTNDILSCRLGGLETYGAISGLRGEYTVTAHFSSAPFPQFSTWKNRTIAPTLPIGDTNYLGAIQAGAFAVDIYNGPNVAWRTYNVGTFGPFYDNETFFCTIEVSYLTEIVGEDEQGRDLSQLTLTAIVNYANDAGRETETLVQIGSIGLRTSALLNRLLTHTVPWGNNNGQVGTLSKNVLFSVSAIAGYLDP
jgi:hypothetical protein